MLPPLTFMVDPTMNLMSRPHHKCEKREHHSPYYLRIIQRVAGIRVSHDINKKFLTCSLQVAAKIQTLNQRQMEAEKLRERSGEEKETSTNKNSHKSKFHYFFGLFLIMFFLFYKIFLILKIDKFIFLKLEVDVAC